MDNASKAQTIKRGTALHLVYDSLVHWTTALPGPHKTPFTCFCFAIVLWTWNRGCLLTYAHWAHCGVYWWCSIQILSLTLTLTYDLSKIIKGFISKSQNDVRIFAPPLQPVALPSVVKPNSKITKHITPFYEKMLNSVTFNTSHILWKRVESPYAKTSYMRTACNNPKVHKPNSKFTTDMKVIKNK